MDLTDVGSYTGAVSPYGLFDLGENVKEWTEPIRGLGRNVLGAFTLKAAGASPSLNGLTSSRASAADRRAEAWVVLDFASRLERGCCDLEAIGRHRDLGVDDSQCAPARGDGKGDVCAPF